MGIGREQAGTVGNGSSRRRPQGAKATVQGRSAAAAAGRQAGSRVRKFGEASNLARVCSLSLRCMRNPSLRCTLPSSALHSPPFPPGSRSHSPLSDTTFTSQFQLRFCALYSSSLGFASLVKNLLVFSGLCLVPESLLLFIFFRC
ncbi:hypothetical protein KC19_2G224800 [Ceratodon purpureus]|uniref:Uncharacterized protein n=1 Tax=Ceratodon purpureus TaxID=3225 RepID=A0A8T0IWV8_CERPU|nr:hypothetical protein KC19_2G224800 [Ceratodon purpureus]